MKLFVVALVIIVAAAYDTSNIRGRYNTHPRSSGIISGRYSPAASRLTYRSNNERAAFFKDSSPDFWTKPTCAYLRDATTRISSNSRLSAIDIKCNRIDGEDNIVNGYTNSVCGNGNHIGSLKPRY